MLPSRDGCNSLASSGLLVENTSFTHPVLLHAHVGQVHVHVVQLLDAGVVLDGAETAKAQPEQVRLEGSEGGDEHVQSQVELLPADQQRVIDVPSGPIPWL